MSESEVAPPRLSLNIPPFRMDHPMAITTNDAQQLGSAPSPHSGPARASTNGDSTALSFSHDSPFASAFPRSAYPTIHSSPVRRSSLAPPPSNGRAADSLKAAAAAPSSNFPNGEDATHLLNSSSQNNDIHTERPTFGNSFAKRSTMLDVLSPHPLINERASSSRSVSPLSANEDAAHYSPITLEPKRRPFSTLLPRDASLSSAFMLRKTVSPSTAPSPSQTGLSSATTSSLLPPNDFDQRTRTANEMTAYEFLDAVSSPPPGLSLSASQNAAPINGKSNNAKGKQRAEVPIVELRVLPVTDAVNMFGSTQTSSNYSLSGKVVVRVHNVVREISTSRTQSVPLSHASSLMPQKRGSESNVFSQNTTWLPEISTGTVFLDPEEFLASQLNSLDGDSTPPLRVQEIKITTLSCTFSGYALYVDHSGRFAACRLSEVTEDLLPNGYTVKIPELGKSQEYEIEFNLSVPGWLPGSSLTRFGGVFYSLEARARYSAFDSEQQHAIPSSLVPPRRASIMPDSPADSDSEPTSVPLRWQSSPRLLSDRDAVGRLQGETPKSRSDSAPLMQTKSTWLGKRTKQLTVKSKSHTSNGSSSSASAGQGSGRQRSLPTDLPSVATDTHIMPPRLYASRSFMSAFSDPIVIVIRRCREVVPVPVARMAIVDADGAVDGTALDPPTSRNQERVASSSGRGDEQLQPVSGAGQASISGPPVAPTTFTLPSDPGKAAAHVAAHSSGVNSELQSSRTRSMPVETNDDGASSSSGMGTTIPMRHFLHRPMLHPPADANIPNTQNGLPFSLTLSLPSYVAVDGPGSDILNFGVQIEVGRSSTWSRVRELGGLRLRSMELSCIQTERHCSVPSRTFCHAYPMPPEPQIGPFDLPVFDVPRTVGYNGRSLTPNEVRQRRGYERAAVQNHMDLLQAGNAPHPSANNVERVRTVIVGPPPTPPKNAKGASDSGKAGRGREGAPSVPPKTSPSRDRITGEPSSGPTTSERLQDMTPETMPQDGSSRRNAGRGRRAYQSAIRGLSNLATAVMDISLDVDGGNLAGAADIGSANGVSDHQGKKGGTSESTRAALYAFGGADGHGVDLTRGRVRMAIKLPLVTSSASRAKSLSTPQLVPDFESPFMKTRHKLQVKLGFGFGSKPLGGEGDWGQSLVMCVPVRFTESAPREVREQFAPMPIRHVALGNAQPPSRTAADPSSINRATHLPASSAMNNALADLSSQSSPRNHASVTPVLPSYNQLFREDGSRLADEGEDLPQYPGPQALPPTSGSVTGPPTVLVSDVDEADEGDVSGSTGRDEPITPPSGLCLAPTSIKMNERSSSLPGQMTPSTVAGPSSASAEPSLRAGLNVRMHSYDNRIAPSRVLDESIPVSLRSDKAARALQRMEMEEMHRDERDDEERRMRRFSSRTGGAAQGGEIELITTEQGSGSRASQLRRPNRTITSEEDGSLSDDDGDDDDDDEAGDRTENDDEGREGGSDVPLTGETVNMDDIDDFDEDVPAFAPRGRQQDNDDEGLIVGSAA